MPIFQVTEKFSNKFVQSTLKFEDAKTDNLVFRLHYKLTMWMLILFSCSYAYVHHNGAINCFFDKCKDCLGGTEVMNDYCFIHGTYTVRQDGDRVGGRSYPGIAGVPTDRETMESDKILHHTYYTWTYFFIVVVTLFILIPRQLWRFVECHRLRQLTEGLRGFHVREKEEELETKKGQLVDYLMAHLRYQPSYAYLFAVCELLNVLVTITLMVTLDALTGHEFSEHGTATLKYFSVPAIQRTDRLSTIFPIMSKCTFRKFGPSGNLVIYDGICVMPLNVVNERGAVFFWYYFMMLTTIGCAALTYRVTVILSIRMRRVILKSTAALNKPEDVDAIVDRIGYSDWFLIRQLGSFLEPVMFRGIMEKLAQELVKHKGAQNSSTLAVETS